MSGKGFIREEELIFRTEDIKNGELIDVFVETKMDRENINFLKGKYQGLLVGSRGTGKTMLLKVAEKEMDNEFTSNKILPVFVSFSKAILVDSKNNPIVFRCWMLSKMLFQLKRKLIKKGLTVQSSKVLNTYLNIDFDEGSITSKLDQFIQLLESTWKTSSSDIIQTANELLGQNLVNNGVINDVDYFKALIEDICEICDIDRIVFLFDEACHNFIPEQQRHFFTLFRDLRCAYISCKAAVYPGITSYGTFQAFHDAVVRKVERDIRSDDYLSKMREIVKNQVQEKEYNIFTNNGENFDALILASSGNPRLLLKSLYLASKGFKNLSKENVNNTIKNFYRVNIWNEHSKLGQIYKGHKKIIDWGRWFVENKVLPETFNKNMKRINDNKPQQTIYFAIHQDAPEAVKQAIKILEYSGIVSIHTEGTKVRTQIYDRYQINFGIVLASEGNSSPVNRSREIKDRLSIKLYTDYSANSYAYENIDELKDIINNIESNASEVIKTILNKSIYELDITDFQKDTLVDSGFHTLEDILQGTENDLRKAYLIGPVRSRRIFNVAFNATIEYISG